jgi:ABC-2 type transport system ATP-binding protein
VWDNLRFASAIYGVQPFGRAKIKEALAFVELGDDARKLGRNLSGGMQRRLGLAATLVHDPKLLFLDEPTGGVDPVLRRKFWNHFRDLQGQGRTLFVTTQYVSEAAYCDLVGVLVQGRLLTVDTPTGLRRRAFGGDVVDVTVSGGRLPDLMACIEGLDFVIDVLDVADEYARLVVSEASTAVPRLVNWCDEQDVEIDSIEEYLPPFDDVFVKLVDGQDQHG